MQTKVGIDPESTVYANQEFVRQIIINLIHNAYEAGIGLIISRDQARFMGGDLTVESEDNKVSFTLKLAKDEQNSRPKVVHKFFDA